MSKAARKVRLEAVPGGAPVPEARPEPAAGIQLARVVARDGEHFRVQVAGGERIVGCDPSVDPALVQEAIASGACVVLDGAGDLAIVGALATARAVPIDRQGCVRVEVERFEVTAEDTALLRTGSAFLRVKGDEVEVFGRRVVTRARELARILARAIQLN